MRQRAQTASGRAWLVAAAFAAMALAGGCATDGGSAGPEGAGDAVVTAKPKKSGKAAKGKGKGHDAKAAETPANVLVVRPKTEPPEAGYAREIADKAGDPMTLLLPPGAVALSQVARPRAEVRVGPGPQFDLADEIWEQGTAVVVFDARGVWRKAVPQTRLTTLPLRGGWVHERALAPPHPNATAIAVDRRLLPTVIAVRDVPSVRTFPAKAPVATAVPRGTLFRALSFASSDVLVWVPETNSMMWISGKDVQ